MNHMPFLCIDENWPDNSDACITSLVPIFDQRKKTNGAADGVVLLLQQEVVCCSSRVFQAGLICRRRLQPTNPTGIHHHPILQNYATLGTFSKCVAECHQVRVGFYGMVKSLEFYASTLYRHSSSGHSPKSSQIPELDLRRIWAQKYSQQACDI
jgi:hypothetical protein